LAAEVRAAAIEDVTEDAIQSMFRAKVQGTWLLQELSKSQPTDFFVAFSSSSAVLGAGNFGTYAAANSFLDAMARIPSAENRIFTSISWGTWQTMRLASENVRRQYSSGGMLPMQNNGALTWLGSLLRSRQPNCAMVANVDWSILGSIYEARGTRRWLENLPPSHPGGTSRGMPKWSSEPGESRLYALQRTVQKEAARVLGFRRGDVPGANQRLADLGLDSLMAVNLRNRLQALIGHTLPSIFVFENPTPAQMAIALDMILWGAGVEDDLPNIERDEIRI